MQERYEGGSKERQEADNGARFGVQIAKRQPPARPNNSLVSPEIRKMSSGVVIDVDVLERPYAVDRILRAQVPNDRGRLVGAALALTLSDGLTCLNFGEGTCDKNRVVSCSRGMRSRSCGKRLAPLPLVGLVVDLLDGYVR